MKKLLVFLFLLSVLGVTFAFKGQNNPLLLADGLEKVCIVADKSMQDAQSVQCGDLVFNFFAPDVAKQNLSALQKDAKSVQYYLTADADEILKTLNASIVCKEQINELCIICAYTPYFDDCIYVEGKKVNVQIAQRDGQVIAGFPAILTGF